MKNKIFSLMIFSIFLAVAVLGIVSAAVLTIANVNYPSSIDAGTTSFGFSFNLTNTGASANVSFSSSTTSKGAINIPMVVNLSENQSIIVNGTITGITGTGNVAVLIHANPTGVGDNRTFSFSVPINPSSSEIPTCTYSNPNDNLRIKKIEFTNDGFSGVKFGKDDEWFPVDEISVEITIENKGDEKIEDIEVEWGLYDPSNDIWVIELDEEDDFDLKSDKSEVLTVEFTLDDVDVDLEDLDEGTYVLYVRAIGYDNDEAIDDWVCDLESEEAEIIIESDFVVLNKISVPEEASCGTDFILSANVWNIGSDDQEGVYVNIYNKDLKIDQDIMIGDVDAFSYEKLDATITLPAGIAEKYYHLTFSVYDEDDDIYENDYDEDNSVFSVPVKVTCTEKEASGEGIQTIVSATLESGGEAGKDLVVKSTVTNLNDKSITYTVSATGYTGWASSFKSEQSTFVLAPGESKAVLFTFAVKSEAQGEQTFNIDVFSGNKLVTTQPVSVSITKKGFSFPAFEGFNYIWAIAILNILLVIVIIVVAIRVMRK